MQSNAKICIEIVTDAEAAKKEAKQVGKKISSEVNKGGKNITFADKLKEKLEGVKKGVEALGQSGDKLGKLGQFFKGGWIAAAAASVYLLGKALADVWDTFTVSSEESIKKFEAELRDAQKNTQNVISTQKQDNEYYERLKELASEEPLHNQQLKEAAFLVEELTKRYGDLGLSVNFAKGTITGLSEAFGKMNDKQKLEMFSTLKNELQNVQALAKIQQTKMFRQFNGNGFNKPLFNFLADEFGLEAANVQDANLWFENLDLEKQIAVLNQLQKKDLRIPEMEELTKLLPLKQKQLDFEQKLKSIEATGKMSRSDYAAHLKNESKNSSKAQIRTKLKHDAKQLEKLRKELKQTADENNLNYVSDTEKINYWNGRKSDLQQKIAEKNSEIKTITSKTYDKAELQRQAKNLAQIAKIQAQLDKMDADKANGKSIHMPTYKYYQLQLKELKNETYSYDEQRLKDAQAISLKEKELIELQKQEQKIAAEIEKIKHRSEQFYTSQQNQLKEQFEIQKLTLQGRYQEAERLKIINQLKSQGLQIDEDEIKKIMQLSGELKSFNATQSILNDAEGLYNQLKPKTKKEAAADKINSIEKSLNTKLSDEQKKSVQKLVELEFSAKNLSKLDLSGFEVKTNELTQRGGFKTGAVDGSANRINAAIMNNGSRTNNLLSEVKTLIQKLRYI